MGPIGGSGSSPTTTRPAPSASDPATPAREPPVSGGSLRFCPAADLAIILEQLEEVHTMNWSRIAAVILTAFGLLQAAPASADPAGTWLTEAGRSRVRVAACGSALCGTVVWLKEPTEPDGRPKLDKNNAEASKRTRPLVGVQILLGAKPAGPSKWTGQVYNAEDGKTYDGTLTEVSPTSVKLEGCALGGLICKSQNWTRIN
jgi:uncharacterized protein (DUF2147 family)